MGRAFVAGVGMAVLSSAASGAARAQVQIAAQDPPIVLVWEAPPGCPIQPSVLDEIHRRLGGRPAVGRSRLRATGTVRREADGRYHVHLTTDVGGALGEKELEDDSCAALANASALVLALTFDPEAVVAAGIASPPPPPPARPIPPPPSNPPPAARLQSARSDASPDGTWGLGLNGQAGAAVGMLPGVAFGASVGAALRRERLRLEVDAAWYPTRAGQLPNSEAGGDFELLAGAASGCYALTLKPVEIAPCAGFEIGRISAQGTRAPRTGAGIGLWAAPFAIARAFVPLTTPVGLRAELGVEVPIFRNRFVLENLEDLGTATVHRASAVVGRAALGVEVRF